MINILLVWMSLPVMAQGVVEPGAVLEKIAPMVSAMAPSYDLFQKANWTRPPRPVFVSGRLRDDSGGPLIDGGLWNSLRAPSPAIRRWVMGEIPDLNLSQVRVMPFSAIDSIARAAIRQNDNTATFLTDQGLRTSHIFYLSREVCKTLFSRYDFGAITIDSGVANDGRKFQIQAMLVGNNKVQVIYDQDNFEFRQPQYPDYPFILRRIVTYKILGPGDMGIEGIAVHTMIGGLDIREIEDAHNGYYQITTAGGYQEFSQSTPITVIPGQSASKNSGS